MTDKQPQLVGIHLYREKTPLTMRRRAPAARAEVERIFCSCPTECPLLKRGRCLQNRVLGFGCVYGRTNIEQGPTPRAKSYRAFVAAGEKAVAAGPKMPDCVVGDCFEIIGEYIYLPYSHMDMCEAVPFVRHSAVFQSGIPFVKLEAFTPEVVVTIAKFRPHAFMGGEITAYQNKSVPLFLLHLKLKMSTLYEEAAKLDASILDKTLKFDKVKTLKTTLNLIPAGRATGFMVGDDIPVVSWDGKWMTLTGTTKQLNLFLPPFAGEEYTLRFRPDTEKTKVTVTDAALIAEIIVSNPHLLNTLEK